LNHLLDLVHAARPADIRLPKQSLGPPSSHEADAGDKTKHSQCARFLTYAKSISTPLLWLSSLTTTAERPVGRYSLAVILAFGVRKHQLRKHARRVRFREVRLQRIGELFVVVM